MKSTFFNLDFGLPVETRTRASYTRVTFANNVTFYDCKNYRDFRFTGRLGHSRAEEFQQVYGGTVIPEGGNTVRLYKGRPLTPVVTDNEWLK